jgi:hypothetical protein
MVLRAPRFRAGAASLVSAPKVRPNRSRFCCEPGAALVNIRSILAAGLIALGSKWAFAEPVRPIFGGVLPSAEINAIVRSMGLLPTGRATREGLAYSVPATDRRGRAVRVIVDARFGDVLAVRRVPAAGPPAASPEPRALTARPYPPYRGPWMSPDFRPPGVIGRARPPGSAPDALPKSVAAPAGSAAPSPSTGSGSVTVGAATPTRGVDPKPTGSTAKAPSFPPVQSLE